MAIFRLPITNDVESYEQSFGIDSKSFSFEFRYNSRNDTWYMNIFDEQNVIRFSGMPCLTNVINMTWRIDYLVLTTGDIMFLDLSSFEIDCTRSNFGSKVVMFYQNGAA